MTELTCKTWRAHRNFLERLKGYEKIYEVVREVFDFNRDEGRPLL
jgi:hypothetical protein